MTIAHPDIILNTVFGKLTVLSGPHKTTRSDGKSSRVYKCRCDCGIEYDIAVNDLLRRDGKATRACKMCRGNLSKERAKTRTGFSGSVNKLYYIYKRAAMKREHAFELSLTDFYELCTQSCIYCGRKPEQKLGHGLTDFLYNGLDRLDNTKGYISYNVVPCCKACNFAKGTRTYTEFIKWIVELVNHNKEFVNAR